MNNTSAARAPSYLKVANALREDLVQGAFHPGQRLKTGELAKRYAAGANAVRESLQQLAGEGWILMSPNRGATVRPITHSVIRNIYELRRALEVCTAIKFVDMASNVDLKALSQIQDQFEAAVAIGDDITCSRQNSAFHGFINAKAGNEEIDEVIQRYGRLMGSIRRHVGYGNTRAAEVASEHRELIAAFEHRDKDAAAQTIAMHLEKSCEDIVYNYVMPVEQVVVHSAG